MLQNFKTIFLITTTLFIFAGCTTAGAIKNDIAKDNRKSLMKIEVGMTKKQIINIFGEADNDRFSNPFKREVKTLSNGKIQEALFFITSVIPDGLDTDDEMTPVILIDNKVIGWGWSFYKESKNNLNINFNK